MARLACIIPVLGSTDGLETTLLSVLERQGTECELVVVLRTRYDDPYHLRGEVRFVDMPARAGRVECLNAGIAKSSAPYLHFLNPGFEVSDGWAERAVSRFDDDPRVAAIAPAIHDLLHHDDLLASGVAYQHAGRPSICRQSPRRDQASHWAGPALHAAFLRREALMPLDGRIPNAVGDQLADVDLAVTLRRAGWRLEFDPLCRVFAPSVDPLKSGGWKWGLGSERLFWRHQAERSRLSNWLAHPPAALADLAAAGWRAPAQLLGRLMALVDFGHYARFRQTLAVAALVAAVAQSDWENSEMLAESEGARRRVDAAHPKGAAPASQPSQAAHAPG